mmetsp:Transcript_72735/g.207170  ORF Transcript_72735/g.207170 Transcript_72735/m.207170 type:complete len:273 (+) Transcript_72735:40-858(+)
MAEASNYGAMEAGQAEEQGYSVTEPPSVTPTAQRGYRRIGVAAILGLAAVAGAVVTTWSYNKDATGIAQLDAAITAPNSAGAGNANDAPAYGRAPAGTDTAESPVGDQGSNPAYGTTNHIVSDSPESNVADPNPTVPVEEDVEERATPGSTKKEHKEHNSDYDRGSAGKTEESPAGEEGSNPADGVESGEAATTPEMGSADNTPTDEDVEMVSKPNSGGVGQDPAARAPEGTATGESAAGDQGSNPATSGGHQTPESDAPEANAAPAVPVRP